MTQKALSPLEQEAMNIVWDLKECSVNDVAEKFRQEKKLAYTTVATLLHRLFEKGLVKKKNHNVTIIYTPKISKKLFGKIIAKSFIHTFLTTFGETAIVSFAESIEKLPQEKKRSLLQLLEKQNENK